MIKLTKEAIDANIASVHYFQGQKVFSAQSEIKNAGIGRHAITDLATLTICVIVLGNGFTVVGESACIDPKLFNEKIGRQVAYDKAYEKIWAIMGYKLMCDIQEGRITSDQE